MVLNFSLRLLFAFMILSLIPRIGAASSLDIVPIVLALEHRATPATHGGQKYCGRPISAPSVDGWPQHEQLAKKFAPILLFDRDARSYGLPMSAQIIYDAVISKDPRVANESSAGIENFDPATLSNGIAPAYYQVISTNRQVRIKYWFFYGMQHSCNSTIIGPSGRHHSDWENIVVTTSEDRSKIAAVTFGQHDGKYTRIAGPRDAPCTPGGTGRCGGAHGFESEGTHPRVYVDKISHGSFHSKNSAGPGGCGYWSGWRNPSGQKLRWNTGQNLISLMSDSEPWMRDLRSKEKFLWGPPDSTSKKEGAISTNPLNRSPKYSDKACEGSSTWLAESSGCYKSECLAGDDQASQDCLKECKHGYDNAGLTCNKGKWPWEWSIYGRLNSGNHYGYAYTIPPIDAGLTKRRGKSCEWHLP